MKLNPEIRKEVIKFASDIEKQFSVNCLVVINKYRIPFAGIKVTLSLTILPSESDSKDAFKGKAKEYFEEYQRGATFNSRAWHCYVAHLYDVRPWFARFADKKERFPLMDMAAGADLISPVVYGEECMARLRKEAEDFFGEGIIEFWKKEADCRQKEKNKKLNALRREEFAYYKERLKLLNKHELIELKEVVSHIYGKCEKEKITLIVALDGSGRPIGRALEWRGIPCSVAYMDPRHLRRVDFRRSDETVWVLEAMKKEFPEVCVALSRDSRSVLFVDDQTGYGHTGKALDSLVKLFSEKDDSSLNYVAMTPYMGNNTPSWLRKRDIQGLEIAPEKSLRAIEAPTQQSQEFYDRLKKIVHSWK